MTDKEYIASLVERAKVAQKAAESLTQEQVDRLAAAIIYKLSREELAESIAQQALNESHMGRLDSKMNKLTKKMPAVLYDILPTKTVGIVERIPDKGIVKLAKALGVIAALVPSTNPEGTPIFKGVLGLRGRNAVIFSPHPATKGTTGRIVDIMRDILEKNGAPADLFQCIDKPTIPLSHELMAQCDITMATGSGEMVKSAYSSGKPAYGVGAGNAVIIIDETADIKDATSKIAMSKTGDWASGCSAENSILVQKNIYNETIEALKAQGGYMVSVEEKVRLEKAMWPDGHHISREIVARPATTIAELAGIEIPEGTLFLMVPEENYGEGYNFSREKISVVLTVYEYDTLDEAIEKVNGIQRASGFGHSCGIHSFDQHSIEKLALSTYTTKVLVRQAHGASNSGAWHNGLANTFSLGCGTWGGNIVSENITQKHFINTTWLSYPIDRQPASDEEIYGNLLEGMTL